MKSNTNDAKYTMAMVLLFMAGGQFPFGQHRVNEPAAREQN